MRATPFIVATGIVASAASCGVAHAQFAPAGPRLDQPDAITAPRMRDRSIESVDALLPSMRVLRPDGSVTEVGPEEQPPDPATVLALVADLPARAVDPPMGSDGVMQLIDGQRIVGSLSMPGGEAMWISEWLPPARVLLESVRAIAFEGPLPPAASMSDVLRLRNGDQLEGVAASIEGGVLAFETGSGEARTVVQVPIDAIRSLSLVSPMVQPRRAVRTWLDDGSVVDAASVAWSQDGRGRWEASLNDAEGRRLTRIRRSRVLAQSGGMGWVRSIAAWTPEVGEPTGAEGMRYAVAAPRTMPGTWALDAPSVVVDGPVRLTYPPAAPGSILVASARRPVSALGSGSFELRIRCGDTEVFRRRFLPGDERHEIRATLVEAPVVVELLPDDGKVVGDSVILERGVVCGTQP